MGFLLYFGCWDEAGHFLYDRHGHTVHQLPETAIPDRCLDASPLFLPHPEKVGSGRITYVIRDGACTTVLAWWGSPFDRRGKVNAAIQCDGWETFEPLWHRFCLVYPDLAKQLTKPVLE